MKTVASFRGPQIRNKNQKHRSDQDAIICVNMTSIDNLANETLIQVFEYLHSPVFPQGDLFSCLLVTRRWHALVSPIAWQTLHLDFNWKLYNGRTFHDEGEDVNPASIRVATNGLSVKPINFDQFWQSLKLFEQKSLNPLQWCRNLTLCIESGHVSNARTASTAELVSILLRCNELRQVQIYVKFKNAIDHDLWEFRLTWVQVVRHLSKQKQVSVQLKFETEAKLARYDYPFDDLRECLTSLIIRTKEPLADVIPCGQLSQFQRLKVLRLIPDNPDNPYSSSDKSLFWSEVEKLPLKELEFTTRYPAFKWNFNQHAAFPTSIRTLRVRCWGDH